MRYKGCLHGGIDGERSGSRGRGRVRCKGLDPRDAASIGPMYPVSGHCDGRVWSLLVYRSHSQYNVAGFSTLGLVLTWEERLTQHGPQLRHTVALPKPFGKC